MPTTKLKLTVQEQIIIERMKEGDVITYGDECEKIIAKSNRWETIVKSGTIQKLSKHHIICHVRYRKNEFNFTLTEVGRQI